MWYLTSELFCGVLVAPLPEEQPGLANGAFCFFFQFLWSGEERAIRASLYLDNTNADISLMRDT